MISRLMRELAPAPAPARAPDSPAVLPPAVPRSGPATQSNGLVARAAAAGLRLPPRALQQDRVTAAAGLVVDDRDLLAALGGT